MKLINTDLAARLRDGNTVLGAFLGIPSPALVEIAGLAGFDFVVIDNEHGPAGIETTEQMLRAAGAVRIAPIVRVSSHRADEILRSLDIGASGVQVPQVNDVAALSPAPSKRVVNVYQDGQISLDGRAMTLEQLTTQLTAARQEYAELGVIVRGDAQGEFQNVAAVLNAVRQAGIAEMGISVRLAGKQGG